MSTWIMFRGFGGREAAGTGLFGARERGSGNGELYDELKVDMGDVLPSAMLFDWFLLMERLCWSDGDVGI